MDQLRSWLKERHQLAVAVYCTPAADAVLLNSGLTIVDLLRPVSLVNNLNVPMRVGEVSYRVQEVKLGLYASNSMYQPKPEVIDEALKQLLTLQSQQHAKLEPTPNIIQQLQTEPPESVNPWFFAYQSEFLRMLRFTEHETLDHPVAGLFFIPANSPQVLQVAQKLLSTDTQQPLQSCESVLPVQDPMFAKHFVLVQDVAAGMDDAQTMHNLTMLSNTYGAAHCSILRLHGSNATGVSAAIPAAVFQACRHPVLQGGGAGEPDQRPPEPPGGLGNSLTADDVAAAGQLLKDFCERSLLPKVEERIARLNMIISNARKGFRNKLTRLWKGAASEPGPSQDVCYAYHTIEAQMRSLADLAFLLGQYDFAVQMYRLAAQDYLTAPNSKWYAGAEELIGICSILTGDPSTDPVKYFNRAFEHYSKVRGRQGRMLATRVMMDTAAYQAATGRHLAANVSLMRAHFEEETARAALLLEAAAYALLRCRPPSARKAAFHLVLAGLRYQTARQRRLSIHCYKQVTGIYPASSWRHINEHLHDILGRQCAELGDAQGALRHCTAVLDCGHRPAAAQAQYLARFLEAVQAAGASGPISNLPLPQITTDSVVVQHADQRCYPANQPQLLRPHTALTDAACNQGDGYGSAEADASAVWSQLEQLVAGVEASSSSNWLDGAKQVHDGEEFNTVAAGEDIGIDVTFSNPLSIKLSLSRVRLLVQFTPAGEAGAATPGSPVAAADGGDMNAAAAAPAPSPEQVSLVDCQLSLHPGECLTERLLVRPCAAGWLRVIGVSWVLSGVAEGRVMFDIKGRRRKKPKGDRPSQQKHYPPGRRLLFHVLKGMPRLQVSLEGMPAAAAAGELLKVQVHVKNVGLAAARNLKVAVSSPHVALAAPQQQQQQQQMKAAAAGGGGLADAWQELQAADAIIQPLRNRIMHRRHQSSGAALTAATAAARPAVAAHARGMSESGAVTAATAAAATAAAVDRLQLSMPHTHSMPSVQEAAAVQGSRTATPSEAAPAAAAAGICAAVFQLGVDAEQQLAPGQSMTLSLWIHVPETEHFEFQCAWYCQPVAAAAAAAMRYRVLLTQHVLSVTTLLDLQPSVSPCVKDLHQYNLRLEATCSKDAYGGVLVLQQLSCLTSGADAGWRLAAYTAAAGGGGVGGSSGGVKQQSLIPNLKLAAGESCTHFVQLTSPAALATVNTAASSSSSSSSSSHEGIILVNRGPLQYFYRQAAGSTPSGGSSSSTTSSASGSGVSSKPRQQQQELMAAAAATAAAPVLLDAEQSSLTAEPPVDLLVLWRFQPSAAASVSAGQQQQQQQLGVRTGFMSYCDLCAALQLNPVRMTVDGPGLKTPIKHDFRASSLCIVPLKLKLRNCGVVDVSLTIKASNAWEGVANDNAWFATYAAPGSKHTGLLGPAAAAASSGGASSAAVGGSQRPGTGSSTAAAAAGVGLPPKPRTPTAPAAAAAAAAGSASGGSAGPLVSGLVPGGFMAGASEGLGAVLGGLGARGLSPLRGQSPLRGADSSSNGSSPAATGPAVGPFVSSSSSYQAPPAAAGDAANAVGLVASSTAAAAAVQAGLPPSSEHIWCGATCVPVRNLTPGDSVEVVLQVGVFRPGVYVLDDYIIDWVCEGSGHQARQGSKLGEAIVLKVDAAS